MTSGDGSRIAEVGLEPAPGRSRGGPAGNVPVGRAEAQGLGECGRSDRQAAGVLPADEGPELVPGRGAVRLVW